jgi:phosphohistidine phosphatase
MKYLIFVRHAKSSWKEPNQADHDRPLNERGLRDAPEMAARLKHAGYAPEVLISSSAIRARTTASFFAETFGLDLAIDPGLYHAAPEVYLNRLDDLPAEISTAVFFGHNPGITQIADLIQRGCTDNVPTCGIVICTFEGEWHEASWQLMKLKGIMCPKDPEYD